MNLKKIHKNILEVNELSKNAVTVRALTEDMPYIKVASGGDFLIEIF